MIYDALIQTFIDGDYFVGCVFWVIAGFVGLMILAAIACGIDLYQWQKTPSFEWNCSLIASNFHPSTLETHAVPVATGKGVGVGVVTTGHDDEYVTIWDCGKYGRNKVDDENVFRYAKTKSVLLLKVREREVKIVGIVP